MGRKLRYSLLQVTDTPDLDSADLTAGQLGSELAKWTRLAPSADAVLVTIRCDVRYVKEYYDATYKYVRLVPGDSVNSLIIAFTHGECLQAGLDIRDQIKDGGMFLHAVVEEAEARRIVFSKGDDTDHVLALIDFINCIRAGRARRKRTNCFLIIWILLCFIFWYFRRPEEAGNTVTLFDSATITAAIAPTLYFKFRQIKAACRKFHLRYVTVLYSWLLQKIRPLK